MLGNTQRIVRIAYKNELTGNLMNNPVGRQSISEVVLSLKNIWGSYYTEVIDL